MADSSYGDGESRLSVHNCVLHAVVECLPEVCETERAFLEDALGAPVKRLTHIMSGCNACEYTIDFDVEAADAESTTTSTDAR